MREPERCAYCGKPIAGARNKKIRLHFCSRECSGAYRKLHPVNTRPGSSPENQWTPVQILITAAIPVYPELQPQVGRRYTAERYAGRLNAISYVVEIAGKRICVRRDECREI